MNMDEATATNNMRVCSLLVCYVNSVNIVTEHLDSFNAPVVNSATLYHELMDVSQKCEIPVKNLLAVLIDSCAVRLQNWFGEVMISVEIFVILCTI